MTACMEKFTDTKYRAGVKVMCPNHEHKSTVLWWYLQKGGSLVRIQKLNMLMVDGSMNAHMC